MKLPAPLLLIIVLLSPHEAVAQSANGNAQQSLAGATVESRDGELMGAIDSVSDGSNGQQMLIIGLAGYLGVGEKDVAVPSKGSEQLPAQDKWPRHSNLGVYGGGGVARVRLPMTLKELTSAPAYSAKNEKTGVPSPHVGTPSSTKPCVRTAS